MLPLGLPRLAPLDQLGRLRAGQAGWRMCASGPRCLTWGLQARRRICASVFSAEVTVNCIVSNSERPGDLAVADGGLERRSVIDRAANRAVVSVFQPARDAVRPVEQAAAEQ